VLFTLAQLGSTVAQYPPRALSHAAGVTPPDMARLSHVNPFGVTGPTSCLWPSFFLLSVSFFLLLFHLAAASLTILDFSSLIRARGVTNRLYELVF
jgi:hypothetical protein